MHTVGRSHRKNTKCTVLTVAKRFFFQKYRENCELRALQDDGFETLILLLIDGEGYKQKSGLAMGNDFEPTLAIVYMNEIDTLIVKKTEGRFILKRLIDDYFAFLLSGSLSAQGLLKIANGLNEKSSLPLKYPKTMNYPSSTCLFRLILYPKHFLPSCTSNLYIVDAFFRGIAMVQLRASKRAILIGKIERAVTCSTDSQGIKESLKKVKEVFNGFLDSLCGVPGNADKQAKRR